MSFFFVHGPTVVVSDDESLSDHVLDSVFKYERVLYLFGFLVGVVDIEKIIRQGT